MGDIMPNYRTWIKYVSANIVFHLITLFMIVMLLIFGKYTMISSVVTAMFICLVMISLNGLAVYAIKRSQKRQIQICKPAKLVAIISLVGLIIVTLFGVNPSQITTDIIMEDKN